MDDPQINILIVDDKPEKVLALEAVLEHLPLTIVRAYSGCEALRQVLNRDFAVILLDVNMPDMDGFETAQFIRQRRTSAHTPIIFLTAMGDEIHAARGYSLGAVDYILTPVVPQFLQSKVAVFVDLYRKSQQVSVQAQRLRQRATQLHQLTGASLAINSAQSVQKIVRIVTETAASVIGARHVATIANPGKHPCHNASFAVYPPELAHWASRVPSVEDVPLGSLVCATNKPIRMTRNELAGHERASADHPPLAGLLAIPLTAREGPNIGLIRLCDKIEGEFTGDDEAIVVQLAQMASVAIENVIYAEEREANRLKDEFLSTLSHELRTPLNAISGWLHLLKSNPVNDDVTRAVQVIDRNVKSQTKLIEDLLDLSRITTGKLHLTLRPISLRQALDAAVDSFSPVFEDKRIELDYSVEPGDFIVRGDPDRLQQVYSNLLGNAAKFTPAGGKITVRLIHDGGSVQCTVTDTGEGIDPEFLPYVFDRFRQADSTSSRRHGGLGIGLTIVQQIVSLHGGSVRAKSPGKGRGSTFTVTLPLAVVRPDGLDTRGRAAGNQLPSLRDIRVLVVDDQRDARDMIAEMLSRSDAEVATAASAAEALAQVARQKPHVLITDLAMPDKDGFDLLRELRDLPNDAGTSIPAIALTACAQARDHEQTRASGFLAHLVKPVDPAQLIHAIRGCIDSPPTLLGANLDLLPREAPDSTVSSHIH